MIEDHAVVNPKGPLSLIGKIVLFAIAGFVVWWLIYMPW